jgi:hypothetical protein
LAASLRSRSRTPHQSVRTIRISCIVANVQLTRGSLLHRFRDLSFCRYLCQGPEKIECYIKAVVGGSEPNELLEPPPSTPEILQRLYIHLPLSIVQFTSQMKSIQTFRQAASPQSITTPPGALLHHDAHAHACPTVYPANPARRPYPSHAMVEFGPRPHQKSLVE